MRARQLLQGVYAGRDINQILRADHVTFAVEREAYRCGPWPLPPATGGVRPSELLDAANEVVPFDEPRRRADLARLRAWRDGDDVPGVSVLLLHGPGGQGKTRLAAHFARESREWLCLHARQGSQKGRIRRTAPVAPEDFRGLLLVVDYSERWSTEDLATLVDDHLATEVPVRMLFLSRPDGWLPEHELRRQGVTVESHELEPLADTPEDRRRVFADACAAFAARLGVPEPAGDAPELDGDRFAEVLTVHMAALAAVHGEPRGLSMFLLDREKDAWKQSLASGDFSTPPAVMERAVCLATLAGPMSAGEAGRLLAAAGVHDPTAVLRDHGFLYPGGDASRVLWPLLPDRLGEDFLALLLPGEGVKGRPWTAQVVEAILADPATVRHALTVLIEVAARWRHCATGLLYPLLAAEPELVLTVDAPVALRLVSHTHDEAPPLFASLLQVLPHFDLRFEAVEFALLARLVGSPWLSRQPPSAKAAAHMMFASVLTGTGRADEAAGHARVAVKNLREAWEREPTEHVRLLLHRALAFYAVIVSRTDRAAAMALSAEAEAVHTMGDDPDDLDALRWRARILKETGAEEEAIALSGEVLRGYAARDEREGNGPGVTYMRHAIVHAGELMLLGRPEEARELALRVMREAPGMADGPGVFLSVLADAIFLVTMMDMDIGDRRAAEANLASLAATLRAMEKLHPSEDPAMAWHARPGLREAVEDGQVVVAFTSEGITLALASSPEP
ncbi:hypothetical protein Afil01_59930 [Actinorhabdospora filicis]|uniref:Uncharacterized protein n=1 Tax=Actinorhabdospora filicis TaxID=1785913 RepID=A0A9W6WD27_9ACTN|nr:hypothetical protein [Actinorhabdospora filicis]GLZ81186.1 hypothetical protein Afil01_59930 [Actinorhabdospora filicis]